ncbi:murein biosynthesis integral membrane protein MurJ, partial [Streptomyces globisporus]
MNAPYDGDRGQGAGGAASPGGPPVPPGAGQDGSVPPDPYLQQPDPYLQHAYDDDPYRAQDLTAQDPVDEALYDRAAHPPPPPGTYQEPAPLYQQPPPAPYAPDP